MHVKSDAVNSAVGRLGIGIGKETEKSNIFAKLALAHEFSGKLNTTYSCLLYTSGTHIYGTTNAMGIR